MDETDSQQGTEGANQAGPQTEPYLFYNVMPKSGNNGEVVSPKVAVTQATSANLGLKTKQPSKRYFVIVGVLLVLAAAGYFAYTHFVLDAPEESLVITPIAHHATGTPTSNKGVVGASPSDWQAKYFGSATCADQSTCGDGADPDRDGLTNAQEYKAGTDPNHADSDNDGLADGDEVNVFLTNPLSNHTDKNPKYTDPQNIKNGYNPITDQKYTASELQSLEQRMKQFGLHEPTITTLGDSLTSIYNFDNSKATSTPDSSLTPSSTSTPASGLDQSPQAKQDRDAQRSNTIQTIATVLLKYQKVVKSYPASNNFATMYAAIKSYNIIATNPVDPINKDPFVYGYAPSPDGSDFTLSFYSETQNQLIKIHAADAQKYADQQVAADNDDQRKTDLESLQTALLLYSNANAAGNQNYVFPTQAKYKTALVPQYLSAVPLDPVTQKDYDYEVSSGFDTFTLKVILQNPPTGSTGYMCNQLDCGYY